MALVQVLDISARVLQVARKCPNGTAQRAIIDAARKLLRESRWYRSTLPGATAAGTVAYNMGSDPYEEIIGIRAMSYTQPNGQIQPIYVSDPTQWLPNIGQGPPRLYAYNPEGQFVLYPTPDAVYPLTVTIVLIPKSGQNKVEERVLAKWDQTIQSGALAYLLKLKGEPWYDPNEAMVQEKFFRSGISNAKADEQRDYQRGSQSVTPRAILV